MSFRAASALLVAVGLALAGCSDGEDPAGPEGSAPPSLTPPQTLSPELAPQTGSTVVPGASAAALAIGASEAMFASAPVVVVAPVDDLAAQGRAASIAVQLGVPMLLATPAAATPATAPDSTSSSTVAETTSATASESADEPTDDSADQALDAELARLGATTVLDVGDATAGLVLAEGVSVVEAPDLPDDLSSVLGVEPGADEPVRTADLVAAVAALDPASPSLLDVTDAAEPGASTGAGATGRPAASEQPTATEAADGATSLPPLAAATPATDLLVLTTADPDWVAASATARAAGARVQVTTGGDPRADAATIAALAQSPGSTVLGLGDVFGNAETLQYRLDVAVTGVELPGGGQVLFPGRRMVALYGSPDSASLGALGEQSLAETVSRAEETAAEYDGLWGDEPVVPAFELITTVASSVAGPDGNYSTELPIEQIRPYVDAAREAGIYVVLDLQPGRTDFLTQAQQYADLLAEPNVGLALDPEWRLEPDQKHLVQIGHVDAAEVNSVVTWLADLTRDAKLPQKLLVLHQFRLDMIENRDQVDTSRDELAVLIHADGNGPPGAKFTTYGALTAAPPPNVWWGWKNFYDEDSPTFTPAETVEVDPSPVFVSYQ